MNSLGAYVRDEMTWRDWDFAELRARTGLDEEELLSLFVGERLADWPSARVVHALVHALQVSPRALVLLSAQAAGLAVALEAAAEADAEADATALSEIPNEVLMRELRRRLALGATTGGYLSTRKTSHLNAVPRAHVG
jgi:hypothetical protein